MDATAIAARVIGPALLAFGAVAITQHTRLIAIISAFLGDAGLTFVTGFVVLILGLTLIAVHNRWGGFTEVVITLSGWLLALRGLLLLAAPDWLAGLVGVVVAHPQIIPIAGCAMALLGAWLCFVGFIARAGEVRELPQGGRP